MIQEFIWDATNFKGPGDIQAPDTSGEKAAAKQNAQQTAAGLRTLGTLLITNGQFRKLCKFGNRSIVVAVANMVA